jgi:endoglucanase
MRKNLTLLGLCLAALMLAAGPALAKPSVAAKPPPTTVKPNLALPGDVSFSQSEYVAHENQGFVTLTIHRTNAVPISWIRYGVRQASALNGRDFDVVPNSLATFLPGQYDYSFRVHVYDLGVHGPPVHATAYLYGSFPQTMVDPHQVSVTFLRDDPLQARDPANPLELNPAPTNADVIQNAPWYVAGSSSPAGLAASTLLHADPALASTLGVIANAPGARRFWFWNEPNPEKLVSGYLAWTQQQQPGTVVQLSTYSLVHGHCENGHSDSPAFVKRYRRWIDHLAKGIGNFRVVLFFEIDSLITTGCLSKHGLHVRLVDELKWSIERLEKDPHLVLYLDAGAADAKPWQQDVRMLRTAGVHEAQGFFLNATHFDWTTTELYYGQRIARALGGVHFVINTGENGRGPLVPANRVLHGNEILCNPPGRGLGPFATNTGYKWADGFLWFSNPGGSGGACRPGAPPIAHYWPQYAAMLVHNAVYGVTGPRLPLVPFGAADSDMTPPNLARRN